MSNNTAPRAERSISEPQPDTASRASVSRSTISSFSPVRSSTCSMNSAPFAACRQASVAISRLRPTSRAASFWAQIASAAIARSIAPRDRLPVRLSPSPRRTMREKASITRNWPGRVGTATRSRQLLVPRSSAA